MQNGINNEERKTSLLNEIKSKYVFDGVLSLLSKDKLVDFYKSPNKSFKNQVKQTNSFQDIFEMVYFVYADEMLIKRNKEIYLSLFEDIFESDLSILKNKLKTLNQESIDQKFAYDRKSSEISSQMLLLWIKMLSVEQIAFDILSLNEESFRNRDLQKELPVKNADDLCKMIKKIVASKSQTRVDKIFDKINNGQAYDYKLQTFDFYANKSGKKFDECENREMVWLNLCATLVGNITDELKNDFYLLPKIDMSWGGCWRGWLRKLYEKNRVDELDFFANVRKNKSMKGYVVVRDDLISICNTIKKIKIQKANNQPIQKSKVELRVLGNRAKTLFDLWCFFNNTKENEDGVKLFIHLISKPDEYDSYRHEDLYGQYQFALTTLFANHPDKLNSINDVEFSESIKNNIKKFCDYIPVFAFKDLWSTNFGEKKILLKHSQNYQQYLVDKKKWTELSEQLDAAQNENQKTNVYKEWQNKIKTKRNIFNQYLNSNKLTMVTKNKSSASSAMSKQKYNQMYKALRLQKRDINLEKFSQTYIHEIMYEIYEYVVEISSYELSESEMADYEILSDKVKSGQVDLNEDADKDNDPNIINETKEQKNDNVGTGEQKLENREQQEYKKENHAYVKEGSGQNSIRKISGQLPRNTVIDSRMNKKSKDNDENIINETERRENDDAGDIIIHRKDMDEKEKLGTNKKIVSATTKLNSNLSQTQKSIIPAADSQRNIYNTEGQNSIIKIVNKTELASKKSTDMSKDIADCSNFDEVLRLYNGKKSSNITGLIKNVQVDFGDLVTMFFWILVRPWYWGKFFHVRNLVRLKKIHDYEKAKNNSKNVGQHNLSLIEKIKNDSEKASNIEKPEAEIGMNTHIGK